MESTPLARLTILAQEMPFVPSNPAGFEGMPCLKSSAGGELLERAKAVVRAEAEELLNLERRLDKPLLDAIDIICHCTGRVAISGVGKSGIIGHKIAATMASTGTPAFFMHPTESLHGDLGMVVCGKDVALLISNSGETREIKELASHLRTLGVAIIAMTANAASSLGRAARVVLDISVRCEACPYNLAPTTSSTVTLALGDALCVALLSHKGFTREDFARLHPAGSLGNRLTLTVQDVMVTDVQSVAASASMRHCVVLLAQQAVVPVVDADMHVLGQATAAVLASCVQQQTDFLDSTVGEVMQRDVHVCTPETLACACLGDMEMRGDVAMCVVNEESKLVAVVYLHDIKRRIL